MAKKTQKDKVLEFLRTHENGMTQRQAFHYGIYRLAAVVFELKREGYDISTEDVKVRNVDGTYSNIGRYHLIGEPRTEEG